MALAAYRKKRNFAATPEPAGKEKRSPRGDSFVIQKHAARRLHYDFRIEMDGVLKSWAVTRGPSLVPGEKRLAVHVEDHPLDYGDFEGTIPKGEYGGGAVIVWDRGRWSPVGDARKGYAKGHFELELHGEKLNGRWHLVRMAKKPREKKENWLLIKGDDEFARTEADPDILEERPESVKTGRVIAEVEGEAPGWSSKTGRIEKPAEETPAPGKSPLPKRAKKAGYPGFIEPTLATLRPTPPPGAKWLHEIKYDGYRLQAHIRSGKTRLLTRSGLDWTEKFGRAITGALGGLPVKQAILDGELIVEGAGGASDFSALQAALSEGRTDRMVFCLFDLLYVDGHDLRPVPLIERKAALEKLLQGAPPVLRYSEHFEEDGELVFRHACRLSLEGIVSKAGDAPYRSGRVKDWIKSKCSMRQEFVVAGFVPSSTFDRAIGSLVLGYYEEGRLMHAGRVGTGFSHVVAQDLFKRLDKSRISKSPFAKKLTAEEARGAKFVRPELVAEVEFRTWTAENLIRHAAFRGLREDRDPKEVVRETGGSKPAGQPAPAFRLTHADRLYWRDAGVTKQGLADYYAEVWPRMGPFIVNRPLALVRCPDGIGGQCFFQKHAWRGQSNEIMKAVDPQDDEPVIAIDGLPGLVGLVQGGTLEIHPWGSQLDDLEHPDLINMDLDPGPGVAWDKVIEAAREVRERLARAGLESFVKTSGGKGLHVVAPLKPRADWTEVKAFAKGIADAMASDSPERFVATVTKAKRKGKILIDYLRNGRGATAVAPYSTRARPGAAVSLPLSWDELTPAITADYFTVMNAPTRLAAVDKDPWEDFRRAAVPLGKKTKRAA
ncbi:DNA ligase D [Chelativorans sp. AA-79]|uniref:DNA ligase D n=1 Tax=Chelativorans sp. AA-79 TaxID=3028735 RepID=UPI0023F86CD6|nr:DNA ligase D [Chelativorans sp. AA-79]WEX07502.1 DNA ligase D [Chelativorans sp. AA-79]